MDTNIVPKKFRVLRGKIAKKKFPLRGKIVKCFQPYGAKFERNQP